MFIGLLGGSFNPIHKGHLHIAHQVHRMLQLDRVLFIPTGDPPHKDTASLAPAHHRLAMVKLAIASFPQFSVYEREIHFPGISYTIDTVTQLLKEYPDKTRFGFIIGLDAFLDIESWKNTPELLKLCQFIVLSRPGLSFAKLQDLSFFPTTFSAQLARLDSGILQQVQVNFPEEYPLILLAIPPCDISASAIRNGIGQGEPVHDWLPPSVESYILQHHLYQCPQ